MARAGCCRQPMRATTWCASSRSRSRPRTGPAVAGSAFAGLTSRAPALRRACRVAKSDLARAKSRAESATPARRRSATLDRGPRASRIRTRSSSPFGITRAGRRCMMQPMPRVPPFDRPATYDDLVKLPDNLVAEIINGELHASPRPAPPHSRAGSTLGVVLGGPFDFGRGGPGGWWLFDEPELHLGADVLVPDLAGWKRERMPRQPDTAYFALAPDWVCEISLPPPRTDRPRPETRDLRSGSSGARLAHRSGASNPRGAAARWRAVGDPWRARGE